MKKFLFGSTALIVMFVGSALAADMPRKAPILKAPPAPVKAGAKKTPAKR